MTVPTLNLFSDRQRWLNPIFLVSVAILCLYLIPGIPQPLHILFADVFGEPLLQLFLLVTLSIRGRKLADPSEQLLWHLLLAGFAFWTFSDFANIVASGSPYTPGSLVDLSYFLFYLLVFLGLEQQPHQFRSRIRIGGTRFLSALTGVFAFLWMYVSTITLPAMVNPELYATQLPSYLFYVALDLILFLILTKRAADASGRWRRIYLLMAITFLAWAITDSVGLYLILANQDMSSGSLFDLTWYLPYLSMMAASRYAANTVTENEKQAYSGTHKGQDLVISAVFYATASALLYAVSFSLIWEDQNLPQQQTLLRSGIVFIYLLSALVLYRSRRVRNTAQDLEVVVLSAQIKETQKMEALGRLAGGVAHDFNNLLLVMQCNLDLMQKDISGLPEGDEFLTQMSDAVSQGASLTTQLLAFGKKQSAQPEYLDTATVIADTGTLLGRTIGELIEIKLDLSDQTWPLSMDRTQLKQLIINLSLNAKNAMTDGGLLTISCGNVWLREEGQEKPAAFVEIKVADTGVGMDEETQRRAYDPFFTTRSDIGGTGLGLSVVYGIVHQNNGHIGIVSGIGKGSCFTIHLPRNEEEPPTRDNQSDDLLPRSLDQTQKTILLAEDRDEVRAMTTKFLRHAGYLVIDAGDGLEAKSISESYSGHIDILITDVVMPRMGGIALAKALVEQRPGVAVLYVSGYSKDVDPEDSAIMYRHFLQKPYTMHELMAGMHRALVDTGEEKT